MSYGGSSMLATMIGFAIVMSAKINHKQLIAINSKLSNLSREKLQNKII